MAMDRSFSSVISQFRAGNEEAAAEIFQKFVHRLVALANRQIDPRMHAKADPEDVVQSVYQSFFCRDGRSPFELSDWDGLWALLAAITVRKCVNRCEFWKAGKRSVDREASRNGDSIDRGCSEAIDRGPTPLHALVLNETLEQVKAKLQPLQKSIIELTLEGFTPFEIATANRCSERTVARIIKQIRNQLQDMAADAPRD